MANGNRFWQRLQNHFFNSNRRRARRRRSTSTTALNVEALEARRLLSIMPPFVHPATSGLVINGSDLADQVNVSESSPGVIHVAIFSNRETHDSDFTKSQIAMIVFYGNDGDDRFTNSTDLNLSAHGGSGNDTLIGGAGSDQLYGGEGDDRILGGSGDDFLSGEAGDDLLRGEGGDDVLTAGAGNDFLNGGADNDDLYGNEGNDQLIGDTGDDRLFGDEGNDDLRGNEGDDQIYGGTGHDVVYGGAGNDVVRGDLGDDLLVGNEGNDVIYGGGGNDQLSGKAGADLLQGDAGNDHVVGGEGADRLYGGEGTDSLWGGDDDDLIFGGEQRDLLYGGAGDDQLRGDDGNDHLVGDIGNDVLLGGEGNDYLAGGHQDDSLHGGNGDDRLRGGSGDDRLFGNEGHDKLYGHDGNDQLYGGDDVDFLYGEAGNDILRGDLGDDYLAGGIGNDNLQGREGNDLLRGDAGDDQLFGGRGDDRLSGAAGQDMLSGDEGADVLYGGDEDDQLNGGDGDDTVWGDTGNDTLRGNGGDDYLLGGAGSDTLLAGDGNDRLRGGDGDDALHGEAGDDLLLSDAGNDTLLGDAGVDHLHGGDGSDVLHGGLGDDTLIGGLGDDTLHGNEGDDHLMGYEGDDTLGGGDDNDSLIGGDGADVLHGQAGDDFLRGDADDDRLYGNEGNDTLLAGAGNDLLFGGADHDLLHGAIGDDTLRGDEGDDQLFGNDGGDTLVGGDGRDVLSGGYGIDVLYGEAGPDLLVGDAGDDLLVGGDGNDLLIGGEGVDSLAGLADDDLLIGATTAHNLATLDLALTVWSQDPDYDSRIFILEQETFQARLYSEITVFDDYVPDMVFGGDGQDWFFLPGAMSIYDPTGTYVNEVDHPHDHNDPHSHLPVPVVSDIPVVEGFALIDSLDDLRDIQENESRHTRIPHASETSRHLEHLALFELVKYADVTHAAVASGNWSDSETWAEGVVPGDRARVLIPIGVSVTVDQLLPARLATLRVDGEISFATKVNTQLNVETMVVGAEGSLQIGTAAAPIAANVTANLRFIDTGPINRRVDPFGISRGLITHGGVEMHGAQVTSHVELHGSVTAGTSVLTLATVPVGWKVGDQIVIAGTSDAADQDEVRQILSIAGNMVTIAPLAFEHAVPSPELKIHVANLSRNVIVDSQARVTSRRGHVMFMHHRDVNLQYARFHQLGRTDKLTPLDDAEVDENWQLVAGTGANNRARYPIHFHRNGTKTTSAPSVVHGSVVADAPGWGYVSHSSYVEFTNNVSYGITGAGFVTEVGDEVGLFQGNIAIKTSGSGEDLAGRRHLSDFGHTGDGFWFQGAGVSVVDNVSVGAKNAAYAFYTKGLRVDGAFATYWTDNLPDPSFAGGADSIRTDDVPIFDFRGNTGYGSDTGLFIREHLRQAVHQQQSLVEDSTFWNTRTGVNLPYAEQITFRNLSLIRQPLHSDDDLDTIGIDTNPDTTDMIYDNIKVVGYFVGIDVARRGFAVVNGGEFTVHRAIVVRNPIRDRAATIQGPIVFHPSPFSRPLAYEIDLRFDSYPAHHSVARIFLAHSLVLNFGPYVNRKVYYAEQAADHLLYPLAVPGAPAQYIGLTTQEISDQFGQTIGGEIAPANAITVAGIKGLLDPN